MSNRPVAPMDGETQRSPVDGWCSAVSSRTGKPCRKRAVKGATVCGTHGGSAPQVKAAAARRLALGEAVAELERLGVVIDVDPAEAMLAMVHEAAGNVAVLRSLVHQLQMEVDDEPGHVSEYGDEEDPDPGWRDELGKGIAGRVDPMNWKAAPHIWVNMYDAERERLVKWAKACRDAGVDERRVQLAESDAQRLAHALTVLAEALVALAPAGIATMMREQLPGLYRKAIETTAIEAA